MANLAAGCILLAGVVTCYAQSEGGTMGSKPNIIVILADDLGYSDPGCYGGEIATPNLDRMAREGLRFTRFYNAGRCSPSRASLLTGLYPHKAGVGWLTTEPKDNTAPGYRGNLSPKVATLPEILKHQGYTNYMSGKWHITEKSQMASEIPAESWPNQRGFDEFFGTINGLADYFLPVNLKRNNAPAPYPEAFYYTDAISDTAVNFINNHVKMKPGSPFFLYVAYTAPLIGKITFRGA